MTPTLTPTINGNGRYLKVVDSHGRPIEKSPTAGYRGNALGFLYGAMYGGNTGYLDGGPLDQLPPFTRYMIEVMRQESLARFAVAMVKAPYAGAAQQVDPKDRDGGFVGFCVDSPSSDVRRSVEDAISKVWMSGAQKILKALDYGQVGVEVEYERHLGHYRVQSVKGFDAQDVTALRNEKTGRVCGIRVRRVPRKPAQDLTNGRGVWIAHDAIEGTHLGIPIHLGAFPPWWELWHHRGGMFARRLWALNNAYGGRTASFIPEMLGEEYGFATPVHSGEIASQLAEMASNGAAYTIPKIRNQAGEWVPMIDVSDPKTFGEASGVMEYPDRLATEVLRGYGIPDNIITATLQDATGTYGGRLISYEAFLAMRQLFWRDALTAIDIMAIRCLIRWNHGPRADYELRPTELVPREKPTQKADNPIGNDGASSGGSQDPVQRFKIGNRDFDQMSLDAAIERLVGRSVVRSTAVEEGRRTGRSAIRQLAWEESEHPREADGEFTEGFKLQNKPQRPKAKFESSYNTEQRKMLSGMDALPGQQDLWGDADKAVEDEPHPLKREAVAYLQSVDRIKRKAKRAKGAEAADESHWLGETDSILRKDFINKKLAGELFGDYLHRVSGDSSIKPKSVPFMADYPQISKSVSMSASAGRWITIGSQGEGDEKHGGIAVFIGSDGVIRKGPPSMTGKYVQRLKNDDFEKLTRRQEVAASSRYDAAARRRAARKEGINPEKLDATFSELKEQDREHIDELKYVLRKARERLGLSTRNKAFASGGDVETLQKQGKAVDDVAAELADSYPHILGTDDPAQQLFDLLGAGLPEYQSDDDLWQQAIATHRGEKQRSELETVPFGMGPTPHATS